MKGLKLSPEPLEMAAMAESGVAMSLAAGNMVLVRSFGLSFAVPKLPLSNLRGKNLLEAFKLHMMWMQVMMGCSYGGLCERNVRVSPLGSFLQVPAAIFLLLRPFVLQDQRRADVCLLGHILEKADGKVRTLVFHNASSHGLLKRFLLGQLLTLKPEAGAKHSVLQQDHLGEVSRFPSASLAVSAADDWKGCFASRFDIFHG
eukprot:s3687_g3.t1